MPLLWRMLCKARFSEMVPEAVHTRHGSGLAARLPVPPALRRQKDASPLETALAITVLISIFALFASMPLLIAISGKIRMRKILSKEADEVLRRQPILRALCVLAMGACLISLFLDKRPQGPPPMVTSVARTVVGIAMGGLAAGIIFPGILGSHIRWLGSWFWGGNVALVVLSAEGPLGPIPMAFLGLTFAALVFLHECGPTIRVSNKGLERIRSFPFTRSTFLDWSQVQTVTTYLRVLVTRDASGSVSGIVDPENWTTS